MKFLMNLSVAKRFYIVVAIPLLGIIFTATLLTQKALDKVALADKLGEIAKIAPEISLFIHDLQKERGASVAFLSTEEQGKADAYKKRLKKFHLESEKHRKILEDDYHKMPLDKFSTEFNELSEEVLADLKKIVPYRTLILNGEVSGAEAVGAYNKKIRNLLNIIEYIGSHVNDAKLTDQFAAYTSIFELQESMSKERALGSEVLSRGSIKTKDRTTASKLHGEQKAYTHVFEVYASKHELELFEETVVHSKTHEHLIELQELFENPENEYRLFKEVSVQDWYDTYTVELDLISKVESTIRDDIQKRVDYLASKGQDELVFDISTTIAQILITLILVTIIVRSITGPVTRLTESMQELADGKLDIEVPDVGRGHQLEDMAKTMEIFRGNMERVKGLEAEQIEAEKEAEVQRQKDREALAHSFEERTSSLIQALSSSADTMQQTANMMSAASEETSVSSTAVSSAAQQADNNVQTVAAATEELTASSQEISRQISDVASRSSTASHEAEQTSQAVNELNELADSIGEVVGAIKDIAEQTNLLALNATIEAARAGEAGKGFAVVADEVKKLANETGQKTEEIDGRVNRIQEAIRASVEAMSRIIDNVQQIDQATSSVAGAIDEQNSATSEIGRNVAEASTGTQQVSHNIADVQTAAAETGKSATSVLAALTELTEVSTNLRNEIHEFLVELRGGEASEEAAPMQMAAE